MKKKILLTNFNMCVGGVERVLINLLNNIDYSKYDVTLYLQFKEGDFLDKVNKNVKVKGYDLSTNKNKIIRKIINGLKYVKILISNYNKYDFAGCFSPPGNIYSAYLVKFGSKNNAIWMHTNIINNVKADKKLDKKYSMYSTAEEKAKAYLEEFKFREFKKNVFISQNALDAYLSLYPEDKDKCVLCRNIINYEEMFELSKEKIKEKFTKKEILFLNVSRHTEHDKKLTRLIDACEKLSKDYKFKVIFIGDGEEHAHYKELVKEKNIEDYVVFLGKKTNPFPYYKNADAFVLTSQFEGFPTVFSESMVMNLPIITTDVSDAKDMIDGKYGIVVENSADGVYKGMKEFLDKGFKIKKKFDPEKLNANSMQMLERLFNNEEN